NLLLMTTPLLLSGALAFTPAMAAGAGMNANTNDNAIHGAATTKAPAANPAATGGRATTGTNANEEQNDAQQLVDNAVGVVQKMKKDPQLRKLMAKARGIYIVPDFGRAGFIVGGRGGAGVVLAHNHGQWSDPAFYDFGGISVGAQAGASGGPIAFLLMSKGAIDAFKSGNKISLNAGAGLSIVTYSANSQASWGKGDIILWSNTKGAYAGATVSVSDLNWADGNNKQFYGRKVDPGKVLAGKVNSPNARKLKNVLPG
ncbi:MAG TPA: lipid-binding SYLF domain-containing protein, partial [Pseudolabrys sp.]|nr:lipid-binding SYLF domain-containing protein [Pseudolabrys sp.]